MGARYVDGLLETSGIGMNQIGNGWTEALCATVNYRADFKGIEHLNFDGSNCNGRL
jgi:hypothetical protein